MHIPESLPKFSDKTLLLVTGTQYGRFYYAYIDKVEKITEFKIPTPRYTDREGFFISSTKEGTLRSGSVYKENRDYIKNTFIQKINQLLHAISKEIGIERIVLFAPNHAAPELRERLHPEFKALVTDEIHGNYTKQHSLDLIKHPSLS